MTTLEIKQHDLEPPLVIDISGASGDLNTVTGWKVIGKRGTTTVFTDTAPGVAVGNPATSAAITHNWVAGETDVVGTIRVEVQATYAGSPGRPQTFPPGRYEQVQVMPDLG